MMTLEELQAALKAKEDELATVSASMDQMKNDNEAMRAKMDELLSETKKAKDAKREAEEAAAKASENKAKENNDFKQLYESALEKISSFEAREKEITETRKREKLEAEAMKLAMGMTKDTAKAELLAKEIKSRLTVGEDGFKVLDDAGQLTISTVDELVSNVKTRYAFLVDANGSTGGGASGANGGAIKPSKKFNEMNGAELSALRKSDPQAYQQLKSEFYGA